MKLKIDNELLTSGFFEDTHLLGIVAPIKDYHFCWYLNKVLNFDFRSKTDVDIQLIRRGRNYYFSLFDYNVPGTELFHYIYNNQNDGEYLLPEFKHLDFLWLIKGEFVQSQLLQQLIANIKKIEQVQLVTILTNEKIKNKEHLVF